MKRSLLPLVVCLLCLPKVSVAQTITNVQTTGGGPTVNAADDFATRALQDPWDMNQKTDLGPWIFGADQPASSAVNPVFTNGAFYATTASPGINFFLLDTGNPLAARVGRIGKNYPIDANKYTHLALRMYVTSAYPESGGSAAQGFAFWSPESIYENGGETVSNPFRLKPGWGFYSINLSTLGRIAGGPALWTGTIKSLRLGPTAVPNELFALDWARLVQPDPAGNRTITWSGGKGDVYLDDDSDPTTVLGLLYTDYTGGGSALPRIGVSSGQQFNFSTLSPGTYFVRVCTPGSTTNCAYSSTSITVGTTPLLTFTSPSEEGSADDFATTNLGNPWDMNALSDLDLLTYISSPAIGLLSAETDAGTPLGTITAFTGTSLASPTEGAGDPYVDPLFVTRRGANFKIDPARYRLLTVEFGTQNVARSILNGSVARVVWRIAGEANEAVSDDIIFNSRAGASVLNRITIDMADRSVLAVEQGAHSAPFGQPQDPGAWPACAPGVLVTANCAPPAGTPRLDIFRFDPHEMSPAQPFFIKSIKLAAFERANTSYTLRWTFSQASGAVDLYYDTDTNPGNGGGTLIASGVNAAAGAYAWNTTSVPANAYYIHAVFRDGSGNNQNETWSKQPLVIDHAFVQLPTMQVNRTQLNFGVTNSSQPSQLSTLPQTIRVTQSAGPSVCWIATTDLPQFMSISPTSQTCGNGTFTVSMNPPGVGTNYPVGDIFGTITVSSTGSGQALNSPRVVNYLIRTSAFGTSGPPGGVIDTPPPGVTANGSLGVTGWVIDDLDVMRVTICRDAVAGEPAPPNGNCGGEARIYIGDANLVEDSRPDIEATFPQTPRNYRAGWGYLLLTNFLPSLGNGPVTLRAYAIDREGKVVSLGSRSIVTNNQAATTPFGAIDTPGQGQTVCGTLLNFGWVLTPQPATVPFDASTIVVFVDNVPVGTASDGLQNGQMPPRSDVQALFGAGGYKNINNHLAVKVIDTTALANGIHSLAWLVTDNLGGAAGVGSRFFTVANPCTP